MTTYNTQQLLTKLEDQTESLLQKAISEWQMTSPALLLKQPAANKWSAAQCLEHLNSYGNYYLPEIEKAIARGQRSKLTPVDEYKAGWLGDYFTKLMEPATTGKKMKKMKAVKAHLPSAELDSDKVISEFIDQQERLLVLLNAARTINLAKVKVPISIAKFIKLQLGDVFTFLIAHIHRHVLQAERAMADPVAAVAPTLNGDRNLVTL